MFALKVFSESLRFLKDHALKTVQNYSEITTVSDVTWILTVPAIWSNAAKAFMRRAAMQARRLPLFYYLEYCWVHIIAMLFQSNHKLFFNFRLALWMIQNLTSSCVLQKAPTSYISNRPGQIEAG